MNSFQEIGGVGVPDSKFAREVTEFIRDVETDLLFHHSVRVYFWGPWRAIAMSSASIPFSLAGLTIRSRRHEFARQFLSETEMRDCRGGRSI